MTRDYPLILVLVLGLAATASITWLSDSHQPDTSSQFAEEHLYLSPAVMKRLTLAFNGVAADWYWMRSLQYVGRKVVAHEDSHNGQMDFASLASLDLRLLPSLLKMSTTLDPQFMPPYYYGAVILPEINPDEAISLLNQGIAANPNEWRLYQHLGYIYWQQRDYQKASEVYAAGAKLSAAPAWMAVMSGRMKAEGGSPGAAREMYQHLYDVTTDESVRVMVVAQIMRLDSLKQQDFIRRVLSAWFARSGRCATSWTEVATFLRKPGLSLEANTLAPLDPSGVPYRLVNNGCDVDLDKASKVPRQ